MTLNKAAAPGEDTGPQAAVPASAVLSASPARWLRAAIMTTRPRRWPKNLLVFAVPLAGAPLGRNDGFGYALLAMFAFGCASVLIGEGLRNNLSCGLGVAADSGLSSAEYRY